MNGNFCPEYEKFTQVDIMIMLKFEIRKTLTPPPPPPTPPPPF